jgi:hypothetical protein
VQTRLDAFARLRNQAGTLRAKIPASLQDAFYQLVHYPILGSAFANERFFEGERGNNDLARAADARLIEATRFFNEDLANGKWRGLMSLEPASDEWSSMRIARWTPPDTARAATPAPAEGTFISLDAAHFKANVPRGSAAWTPVPGLGRTGKAVTVLPTTFQPIEPEHATETAPRLDYTVTFPAAGEFTLHAYLLPTHPITGSTLRFAVALDDAPPQLVSLHVGDGGPGWSQGVLDAARVVTAKLTVPKPGAKTLRLYGTDAGVVVDKFVIDLGGLTPTYLGPPSQR